LLAVAVNFHSTGKFTDYVGANTDFDRFIEVIAVPKNLKFLAVPLYELYENAQAFGPQLAALPHYLARYRFEYVDEQGNVVAVTPGTTPDADARTHRDDTRFVSQAANTNGNTNGNGQQAQADGGDTEMPE
jgi:Nucleotide hydrolase